MKKLLIFLFCFFFFIGGNALAISYIKDINVNCGTVGTKIDIETTEEIKYLEGKLEFKDAEELLNEL